MAIDPDSLSQPRNNLMLAILADPDRAASLLRASLEPWIVERLTDQPPVPLEGSFVDEELRATRSDKLFRVQFKNGQPGYVFVLLEHKSHSDPGTALQITKYKTRIWEAYAQGRADRLRALPAIILLVLYHGREPWTAPRSLAAMLADEDERIRGLESPFGYYLRDLGSIPISRLATNAGARAGLVALRYSHADAGVEAEKLAALHEVLAGLPDGTEFERQVVVYILNAPVLRTAAGRAKPGRGEQLVGEIVQELINQGKAEGKADALMRLLQHRFGPLPRTVHRQIVQASSAQLDTWFGAALSGQSLTEVLQSSSGD